MSINPFGSDFLSGGGEMGALIRSHDWQHNPLGRPENWPHGLKAAIRIMLNSMHPMFIWWGPDLIQFYNDAYKQTMGPERHPSALGAFGRQCWDEIWDTIGPQIEFVMTGHGSTWDQDKLVPVTRYGQRENVWWTYSYSPIEGDHGVGGVLVVCQDVTKEHLARQQLDEHSGRLKQLFEQAPGFVAVLRGPDHVFEVTNASYRALVGQRDVLNRPVREALPDVAGQGFFELLDGVIQSGMPYVGRRQQLLLDSDGETKTSYVDFIYQPIFEADGSVSGIFVQGTDVTDLYEAESKLRNKEIQLTLALEAAGIGVWECTIANGHFINLTGDERTYQLLESMPDRAMNFETFTARVHPDDLARVYAATRKAVDSEGDGTLDVEYRILSRLDQTERWIHARARRVELEGVRKLVGTVREVSDAKADEARQELVSEELNHRIKNLFMVVSSIANQTLRGEAIEPQRDSFNARLRALSRAQDLLLSKSFGHSDLREIVAATIAPVDADESRFDVSGPAVFLTSKQTLSLALALHELATNALKYGGLSNETGRVKIFWTLSGEQLRFVWQELGGPPVAPPTKNGFGTRLITRIFAKDFDGEVEVTYAPSGLICILHARLPEDVQAGA